MNQCRIALTRDNETTTPLQKRRSCSKGREEAFEGPPRGEQGFRFLSKKGKNS